jgi:hypothetical protein
MQGSIAQPAACTSGKLGVGPTTHWPCQSCLECSEEPPGSHRAKRKSILVWFISFAPKQLPAAMLGWIAILLYWLYLSLQYIVYAPGDSEELNGVCLGLSPPLRPSGEHRLANSENTAASYTAMQFGAPDSVLLNRGQSISMALCGGGAIDDFCCHAQTFQTTSSLCITPVASYHH